MTNGFKQRAIEILEADITHNDKVAQMWRELDRDRVLLEDLQGNVFGSARDMAEKYNERAKELRDLLARIRE